MTKSSGRREGSLDAPIRHPINWQDSEYFNPEKIFQEMERVFNICHGCRRCVSLCNAFPTLFDLVDKSKTLEIDSVDKKDYWNVVDHCYLCDLCYMTKCPYVPPHEWNVDFPHMMLQAKAVRFRQGKSKPRDRILTSTDMVGRIAGIPVVAEAVNSVNKMPAVRKIMDSMLGIHADAVLPVFHSNNLRKRFKNTADDNITAEETDSTRGKVALFITCYGNRNNPHNVEDLIAILRHNGIPVRLTDSEHCCGMPKLELGDLESVAKAKEFNVPELARLVDDGWDILAPIPSCVLMFKQEIPLMYPDDVTVKKVKENFFDPFEYLVLRHKAGKLNTQFKNTLGRVAWHVPCHQRVQNIGQKTRDILELVPGTEVEVIERCSGHDGTYAIKSECHDISRKICQPIATRINKLAPAHFISDCPMAGQQIQQVMESGSVAESLFSLIRYAYGI